MLIPPLYALPRILLDRVDRRGAPFLSRDIDLSLTAPRSPLRPPLIRASGVFAHADIYDALVAKVAGLAGELVVGDPMEPGTALGPLCNPNQLERVLGYIGTGQQEGARLVCGGQQIGTEGYYVQPTVFADVTNTMRIAREEIFGPVGVFIKFSTKEEAVAAANDSEFGLAAGVWSSSLDTALWCSVRLCAVSGALPTSRPRLPPRPTASVHHVAPTHPPAFPDSALPDTSDPPSPFFTIYCVSPHLVPCL